MKMDTEMPVVIDGSQGEGGGQILRTALSLSVCLNRPIIIENIRANRSKPGLLRQHLACLRAAREICGARVTGDRLGADRIEFIPGNVKAGHYRFAVGSAGSSVLVFQTVLMPLLMTDKTSELLLEGGTHNGMAPSYDYMVRSFLPIVSRLGFHVETNLQRHGFFPAGGGAWTATIKPGSSRKVLSLLEPGELKNRSARALSANLPEHIAERELLQVKKKLQWETGDCLSLQVKSVGPGNILSLQLDSENASAVFEVVGEKKLSAEKVADRAVGQLQRFLQAQVPVEEHLADQLLLPLALTKGGCFRTTAPSQHLLTNVGVIEQMLDVDIHITECRPGCWEVCIDA